MRARSSWAWMLLLAAIVSSGCRSAQEPAVETFSKAEPAVTAEATKQEANQAPAQPQPSTTDAPTAAPSTETAEGDEAAAPSAEAPKKLSRDAMCEGICARAAELHCPRADECPKRCAETMTAATVCEAEFDAATTCVLARPAADWQCTPRGLASIKDPHCIAEQKAFGDCLYADAEKRAIQPTP